MTEALTGTPWLAVLDRIRKHSNDLTSRTLAAVLYDIVKDTHSREVDQILDAYAFRLLGSL
jgi:hypothetical protein